MRIVIKESGESRINLCLPTLLVLNQVSAALLPRLLRKGGIQLSYRQAAKFIRALNQYRRAHRDWTLVEAYTGDGSIVQIMP